MILQPAPLNESQRKLLESGIELFNRRQFFECHEVLEEAWVQASGEQKLFLQGIIQVAVSLYHLGRENLVGSRRLLRAGIEKLEKFPPAHESVDVARLLASLHPLRDQLEVGAPPEGWQPLQITTFGEK